MTGVRELVRRLTHLRGANFSLGFRLLPADKRRAVYAAYAACRIPDDIVDEPAGADGSAGARARLEAWAEEIDATYRGRPSQPATRALSEVLQRFPIPKGAFLGLVDGCRMDLETTRYATFAALERYCELVAVTISEISLAIFGVVAEGARDRGRDLAMALQLTNICRDVGEDAGRGRLYLPEDEVRRFGTSVEAILEGRLDAAAYRDLMVFECARARRYFQRANTLPGLLQRDSRAAVRVMGGVYRRVLDRVAADPVLAWGRRVELPRWQRAVAVAAGLAGRPFVSGER